LRTLISNQSKYDEVITNKNKFTKTELEGFVLVNDQTKGDCLHCHTTDGNALGTTIGFSNNGLDSMPNPINFADKGLGAISKNLRDNGKFKIPSLRNIALTNPYMHDGRFKTLEEVLDFYSEGLKQSATLDPKMEFVHQGGAHLTGEEKHSIIAFLKTLTDTVFIHNTEYSNPFKN
jgi:cytochrome c peroxidase